jgi:hypothetical protein
VQEALRCVCEGGLGSSFFFLKEAKNLLAFKTAVCGLCNAAHCSLLPPAFNLRVEPLEAYILFIIVIVVLGVHCDTKFLQYIIVEFTISIILL